jgi:hypothetical protein
MDQYFSFMMIEFESKIKENYTEGEYSRIDTFTPLQMARCPNNAFNGITVGQDSIENWRCLKDVNNTIY